VTDHAPPNVLLVAIDELDDVVGFTAVHPREGEMFLLFVHPKHAGRGVGRALLDGRAWSVASRRLQRGVSVHARRKRTSAHCL
jgi:GNAT superfamily N-acetyltransferase